MPGIESAVAMQAAPDDCAMAPAGKTIIDNTAAASAQASRRPAMVCLEPPGWVNTGKQATGPGSAM
jgi:hypothetical protein